MTSTNKCLICGHSCKIVQINNSSSSYECKVCGKHILTVALQSEMEATPKDLRARISACISEMYINRERPKLMKEGLDDTMKAYVRHIQARDWTEDPSPIEVPQKIEDILNRFPSTVSERFDRTLKNLHHLSSHPGESICLDNKQAIPIFFAENEGAYIFFRNALQDDGLIEISNAAGCITLTAKGWNRIAEIERNIAGKNSNQGFVAMAFDKTLDCIYKNGIERAINENGYTSRRMDLKEHNEKICDAIIAEIRKSRFIVADFTLQRSGVYFEAGYALGLGIPVIWTCKESDKENLHFDTRQYNHILWGNELDLYKRLGVRIKATI